MKMIIKFRIFLWLVLLAVVGWLLYAAVVPSGRITYVYNFTKKNGFIGKLTPAERVEPPVDGEQKVIGDPVYFNLRTPRAFDKARMTIRYKDVAELPVIEAGVLADKAIWRYDLQPVENKKLDQIALVWDKIEEDGVLLFQREKKFDSLAGFIASSSEFIDKTAVYNYNLNYDYRLDKYSSGTKERVINQDLRGSYEFYTYIDGEDLDYSFGFLDINKNDDPDAVDIHLYFDNELIDSRHLPDDEAGGASGQPSTERVVEFKLANLPAGVYKIEVRASDDIITRRILTRQKKLSFRGGVRLAKEGNTGIKIFTDSRIMYVKTMEPDSLQDILVGDDVLQLAKTYKQFSIPVKRATGSSRFATTTFAHDGVIIAGDGVFSFSPEEFINPQVKKVDASIDINELGIDYILAKYIPPAKAGDWQGQTVEFDLKHAYREDGAYSVIISLSGLLPDDGIDNGVLFDEIRVDLEGKSLVDKIKQILNK